MDDPVDRDRNWKDKLFEPTVEMMVNDFDDEQTLEEEERMMSDPSQVQNELDELEREGELPIEELLRLYNCPPSMSAPLLKVKKPRKKRKPYADSTPPADDVPPAEDTDNDSGPTECKTARLQESCTAELLLPEQVSADGIATPPPVNPLLVALTMGDVGDEDDDDEDDDEDLDVETDEGEEEDSEEMEPDYYAEEADFKKCILIGENHQAEIPEFPEAQTVPLAATEASPTDPSDPDQLLWSPHSEKVKDGAVERFLASFYKLRKHANNPTSPTAINSPTEETASPAIGGGAVVKDEESALLKLLEADYNVEVALQQVRNLMSPNGCGLSPPIGASATTNSLGYSGSSPVSPWSEEECRNFELGIRLYGKNFPLIQQTKVPTRTVPELVQFYYFWKKTERYDSFAAKQRLEKKKHSSQNPGLTEFMDKFLEEQQQRSISPRQTTPQSASVTPQPLSLPAMDGGVGTVAGSGEEEAKNAVNSPLIAGGGAAASEEVSTATTTTTGSSGNSDGGHSLLIYADSKRHRGAAGVGQITPPVNSDQRNPMEMATVENS